MSRAIRVAIDGPAGAGKSSVARALADALGYTYVDTGALYRAVACRALRAGLDVDRCADDIARLARSLEFEFREVDGEDHVFVDGEDLAAAIRTPQVGNLSSPVSAIPAVRQALLDAQRRMASRGGTVMEGRDIGTVVLPDAEAKIFLIATPNERARRRRRQLQENGIQQDLQHVLDDITERDRRDSTREIAPLRKADDAVELVSDGMTQDEVVARACEIVRRIQQEVSH